MVWSTEIPPNDRRAAEHRATKRHTVHRACLVYFGREFLDGQAGVCGSQAVVVDLSAEGVGLLLRNRLPPCACLGVCGLGSDEQTLPQLRVVRCEPMGGQWLLGCILSRRLTEEEMRPWLN